MEIVRLQPRRVGVPQPLGAEVVKGAQTAGALEHHVDQLGGDAEVGQHQHREPARDRLQRRRRGDRHQTTGPDQRVVHRALRQPDPVRSHRFGGHQVGQHRRVGPGLAVGLLLVRSGPQLHHRRPVGRQAQQDGFPVGPGRRHLGLRGEHQVRTPGRPWAGVGVVQVVQVVQERQPGQAEPQPGGEPGPEGGELGQFAATVHHEQVTAGPGPDRPAGGRHRDTG